MDPPRGFPAPPLLPISPGAPLPLPLPPLPPGPGGPPLARPPPPPPAHAMPPPGSPGELMSPGALLDEEAFWAVHELMLADEATNNGGGAPPGQQRHHPTPHHMQQQQHQPGGYDTFLLDPVTGALQLQPHDRSGTEEDEDGSSSNDDDEISDDDEDQEDGGASARGSASLGSGAGGRPPFHLPPSILGSHLARLRPRSGGASTDRDAPAPMARRSKGRGGAMGARRGGRGGGAGGGRGPLDEQQLTRRLRQKAESYERKKSRAKAGRKVLKARRRCN